ncbi:unnamed protein product [Dibothriocephalus latus]|uniref:DNA replication licensing factor MCM6 n=1 Tax=Dibothriocephalus latus TaxID=60516 RepID=A0A3P7NNI2_DIBLA|nr:unnamed protein product [Dibothriocephalus latus]
MDVAQVQVRTIQVADVVGDDCQKRFQIFLESYKENETRKYVEAAKELKQLERSTLSVNFEDLLMHDSRLASLIEDEYYRYKHMHYIISRLYPFLCNAVKNFINDHVPDTLNSGRDFYISFTDISTLNKIRELNAHQLGKLVKIRAQVVRSHPVHPELTSGTFKCSDCGIIIRNVEQQFKYTQPSVCFNPQCGNRSKFELLTSQSKFVDFQKVRTQETQAELSRGSIPRR